MMRWLLLCLLPTAALAESVVTTRIIRPGEIVTIADLNLISAETPNAISSLATAAGKEARIALYPGRPLLPSQLEEPAIIQRNQLVYIVYRAGPLTISTEGRALGRGALGDVIPILNLSSRNTIQGQIMPDGTVRAGPTQG